VKKLELESNYLKIILLAILLGISMTGSIGYASNAEADFVMSDGETTTLAEPVVEYLSIDTSSKQTLGLTFDSFAALTAGARVEASMHYPSDVLAGWAVGHFVAHLAQDFIDPDQQKVLITAQLTSGGSGIQLVIRF